MATTEDITIPLTDEQIQVPLDEDERQILLDFAEGLPAKNFAQRMLIQSCLWNLEKAENDLEIANDQMFMLRNQVNRLSTALLVWMRSSDTYKDVQIEFKELRHLMVRLYGRSANSK